MFYEHRILKGLVHNSTLSWDFTLFTYIYRALRRIVVIETLRVQTMLCTLT